MTGNQRMVRTGMIKTISLLDVKYFLNGVSPIIIAIEKHIPINI